MRRRSTPLRIMLLSSVASLVFVLGVFLSTGTASAHTASKASVQTAASSMDQCQFGDCNNGCDNGEDCNNGCQFSCCQNNFFENNCGCISFNCGVNPCLLNGICGGCVVCGFNNCNSLEPFIGGVGFSPFDCGSFFFFHRHRHHRHLICFHRRHHRRLVCVFV
jgi:hypothetical protein